MNVYELLVDKGIRFTVSGRDYLTTCFNPEHVDTNPSFRIDRMTGVYHCFSCGWKGNLFKHFGVASNNASIRVAKLKEKLRALDTNTNGLKPLQGEVPFNRVFRGISSQTLKEFGAFTTDSVTDMQDRIIFPIKDIRDKVVAYVGRHTVSDAKVRYKTHPAQCTLNLYPYKLEHKPSTIVLVEGLFDLLNVWDKGMKNAVCTFGTGGLLNNTSEKLLPFKAMGIQKIYIMYDADKAGIEAADKLLPLILEAGFACEKLDLREDEDPGELSQQDVNDIMEYIQK